MKRIILSLLCLLCLAGPAYAQTKVIVVRAAPAGAVAISELSKVIDSVTRKPTKYVGATASTYSEQTAKYNAEIIQDSGRTELIAGKAIYFDGEYAVCDHDATPDGIDIHWDNVQGGQLIGAGQDFEMTDSDSLHDRTGHGLIHVQRADDTTWSDNYVLRLQDFYGWDISGIVIKGRQVLLDADGETEFAANPPRVANGLWLRADNVTTPSGKSIFNMSFVLCDDAVFVNATGFGGNHPGPDNLLWTWLSYRSCHEAYVVDSPQSVEHVFLYSGSSGSAGDGFRFMQGGNAHWVTAFAPYGTFLTVEDTVGTGSANFRCENFRADANVLNGLTICDIKNNGSQRKVVIKGSLSDWPAATRQLVKVEANQPGYSDVQIDIHGKNFQEGWAYPLRPIGGQWVPRFDQPQLLPTTTFFFDADRETYAGYSKNWSVTLEAGATPVHRIVSAADLSTSANTLVVDGSNPTVGRGIVAMRDAAVLTGDHLVDYSPASANTDALGDMTVVAVFTTPGTGDGANRIFGITNVDGNAGIRLGVTEFETVTVGFGADADVTTTAAVETEKTNIVIAERNATAGTWKVQINGGTVQEFLGKATGDMAALTSSPNIHIGARVQAGPSWISNFEGNVSQIIVDESLWTGTPTTLEMGQRLNYLKQFGAWCNDPSP